MAVVASCMAVGLMGTLGRSHIRISFNGFIMHPIDTDTDTDATRTEGLVQGIAEVEEMFSHNIVQGKLNDQGNYGAF